MTLDNLKAGESGIIMSVGSTGTLRRRLLEIGLTPHTYITVLKTAPMGDPMEVFVRGYVLAVRKKDARTIMVCKVVS